MPTLETPRSFARWAPGKVDRQQRVRIRVTDMTGVDALWWDRRIGPHHLPQAHRADRYWSWSALLPLYHLIQRVKNRFCRPLVVWAQADNGLMLRVALSIIIEHCPHLDTSDPAQSHFVWFMSAAEAQVLAEDFQMTNPPSLARVLLDNAIVLSQAAGQNGRIGLHAARAGGDGLLAVYVKSGLTRLPALAPCWMPWCACPPMMKSHCLGSPRAVHWLRNSHSCQARVNPRQTVTTISRWNHSWKPRHCRWQIRSGTS